MIRRSIRLSSPSVRLGWALPPLLAAAVFLVAFSAIILTRESGRIAAIWPSNALIVAVLLSRPRSGWPTLILAGLAGNAAANALGGDLPVTAVLMAFANMLDVILVASIAAARRRLSLTRRSDLFRFAAAVAVGCLASTAFAQLVFLGTGVPLTLRGAALWLTADTLGLLIFTPLLLELLDRRADRSSRLSMTGIRELWAPLALVVAVTVATFSQTAFPLLFLPVAALALVAASAGLPGGAMGVVCIGAVVLIMSPRGWGPISLIPGDLAARVVFLQLYLLVLTGLSMIVGAIASERRRLIHRLTKANAARIDSETRVRGLLSQSRLAEEMAHVGYWTMDATTGAAFWSPEVYRIHGVEPGEFEVTVEAALDFYTPEDGERFRAASRNSRLTGEGWEIDAVIVRRSDGARRLTRCLAHAEHAPDGTLTGFFGVLKDLTEEREAAAAAAERDSRYRLLADNASDVIALYGPDSIFRYVSPAVSELLGYQPEELVGRSTYDVIHPDDHAAVARAFARAASETGPAAVEYRACTRDGAVLWLEAKPRFKRDEAGRIIEIHDCVRDVSDRREREIALAAARQAAERASEAKARFLGTMSHEIRTPLHGVLGFADVLAKTGLNQDQAHYVDRIRSAGRSLALLIDDILDFSRIEAGRMPLDMKPFNLRAVVSEVVEMASATATHLSFSFSQSPAVQDWVFGDHLRVRQVITNLVGNAAKFTPAGSVQITIDQVDERLLIRVTDDGIGLSPELEDTVFDLFVQADAAVGRKFGGAGLGLTISRSLGRMMGGDVTLENRIGQGAIATLELPYAPAAPPPDLIGTTSAATRRLRILVVDDADMNLELMRLLLTDAGHEFSGASSGAAGVARVRDDEPFDLVLMDIQMPDIDGLTASRMIRELEGPVSGTPIIAITADALPTTVQACRKAGIDDHLSKPVRADELLARINRLAAGNPSDPFEVLRLRYRMRMAAEADELDAHLRAECAAPLAAIRETAHRIAGTAGSLQFEAVEAAARALCDMITPDQTADCAPLAGPLQRLTMEMRSA